MQRERPSSLPVEEAPTDTCQLAEGTHGIGITMMILMVMILIMVIMVFDNEDHDHDHGSQAG